MSRFEWARQISPALVAKFVASGKIKISGPPAIDPVHEKAVKAARESRRRTRKGIYVRPRHKNKIDSR